MQNKVLFIQIANNHKRKSLNYTKIYQKRIDSFNKLNIKHI